MPKPPLRNSANAICDYSAKLPSPTSGPRNAKPSASSPPSSAIPPRPSAAPSPRSTTTAAARPLRKTQPSFLQSQRDCSIQPAVARASPERSVGGRHELPQVRRLKERYPEKVVLLPFNLLPSLV